MFHLADTQATLTRAPLGDTVSRTFFFSVGDACIYVYIYKERAGSVGVTMRSRLSHQLVDRTEAPRMHLVCSLRGNPTPIPQTNTNPLSPSKRHHVP